MNGKRLYYTVANQIRGLIEKGSFPPGSRLPGERDLAEKFGVSRMTVREAEIALEAVGLLDIRIGSGVYVKRPPASAHHAVPAIGACELTEARAAIESEAAALAATAITDEELMTLNDIVDRMEEEASGFDRFDSDSDRDFHIQIAKASRNNAMFETIKLLWKYRLEIPEIRAAHVSIRELYPQKRLKEHREILIALQRRDKQMAREAMRSHFQHIIESLLEAAEARAIEDVRRRTKENRARFLNETASR